MKRVLLVLLALVPGVVLLGWLGSRGDTAVGRWQPLPSGGEVRVRAITYGARHEIDADDRSLLQRAQDWWKGPRPKGGPSRFARRKDIASSSHGTVVWCETRGQPESMAPLESPRLHLPEGEIFRSGARSQTVLPDGRVWFWTHFKAVPYRAARLRVSMKIGADEVTFDLANPAARHERLYAWTPRPLPQTARSGDVALTLRSLDLSGHLEAAGPWRAQSEWEITDAGREAKYWYSLRSRYEDPGGNSSIYGGLLAEPVWRVRVTARRTDLYPYLASDVHWLGTIDPAATGSDAALPLDLAAKLRGLKFVGVLPAGTHVIDAEGAVTRAVDRSSLPAYAPATMRQGPADVTRVHLTEPKLVILAGRGTPQFLWREAEGGMRPIVSSTSFDSGGYAYYVTLPSAPTVLGIAEEKELTFDFYVAAPERPQGEPSPAPR